MAYRFKTERNLSRQFRDLSIGMLPNPNTEDFAMVKNENAIKQSIRNLVLTQFGERPFQPNNGSRLKSMLFENFDVFMLEDLKSEIVSVVGRLEPRVELTDVIVKYEGGNELEVEVEYRIVGETLTQTVDFLLERT
jgi:phage baseplate assembly protein W